MRAASDRLGPSTNSLLDLPICVHQPDEWVKVDVIARLRGLAARGAGAAQRPLARSAAAGCEHLLAWRLLERAKNMSD